MSIGPNIKRAGAWLTAFLVAQGMVYHFGYESGYVTGERQGYGDVWVEAVNKAQSDEMIRRETTAAAAAAASAANDRNALARNAVSPD